jgi:hypothetical protein
MSDIRQVAYVDGWKTLEHFAGIRSLSRPATEDDHMKHEARLACAAAVPVAAEPGSRVESVGTLGDRAVPSGRKLQSDDMIPCTANMVHGCNCGSEYVVIPKEIPLAKDEPFMCASCGCELRGRWSSRNFDYEPFHLGSGEELHSH